MERETSIQKESSPLEANRQHVLSRLKERLGNPQETFLREHQTSVIKSLYEFLDQGKTAGYISEPGGSGKTAIMMYLAELAGLKTVILSHTRQLLEQTSKKASALTPDLDITNYYSREKDSSGKVMNTTYQSLVQMIKDREKGKEMSVIPRDVGLVLCDEVDLGLGEVRHTIYKEFPNALLIGLTATPYFDQLRGYKERGMVREEERWTELFTDLIHEMTIEEAMERGINVNLDVHLFKTNTTVSEIEIVSTGDYKQTDVKRHFDTLTRNALAVAMIAGPEDLPQDVIWPEALKGEAVQIHKKIAGKKTVIFAIDIDHAETLAAQLVGCGISAKAIHSKLPPQKINEILESHKSGETQVVIGINILGRGWDSPETEVAIFLRPTRSGVVLAQQLPRIMRPCKESGKEKAIAIQLIDKFEQKVNSPVLISDLFDPYYILTGTQTGKDKNSINKEGKGVRPVITFSGINIESVIEEARTYDILRTRFKRGSVEEIAEILDRSIADQFGKNSRIYTYDLLKKVAEELPGRLPAEVQQKVLQAAASIDTNTRSLGKKIFSLLNAKTILTVVDSFFLEELDTPEDREEMTHSAVVLVNEFLTRGKISVKISASQQVHSIALSAVAEWIANKENVPMDWIEIPHFRQIISQRLNEAFEADGMFSGKELENIAKELSQKTDVPYEDLLEYIKFKNSLTPITSAQADDLAKKKMEGIFVEEEIAGEVRREIDQALESGLGLRNRKIMEERYGLNDGKKTTLRQIGQELGMTGAGVSSVVKIALKKLRHPLRSKGLMGISRESEDFWGGYISVPESEEKPAYRLPNPKKDWEERLFDYDGYLLRGSGIRNIEDFFSAPISEIAEHWTGDYHKLKSIARILLQFLDENIDNDISLFNSITNAILYKMEMPLLASTKERTELYNSARNEFINFFISKESIDNFRK